MIEKKNQWFCENYRFHKAVEAGYGYVVSECGIKQDKPRLLEAENVWREVCEDCAIQRLVQLQQNDRG